MSFNVAAGSYARFMGRYSEPLADEFVRATDPRPGQRVVDVGCGPGVLTARLVDRLGPDAVSAIDPSETFVTAARERLPGVDIRVGSAEELPWAEATFDTALAQLVVHFMSDPVAGLREMARVTRPGGLVAASVWDFAGDRSPLSTFWAAVREIDPAHPAESQMAGVREGHLAELFTLAGLADVGTGELTVQVALTGFDEWWEPYTLGVGPAGEHVAGLDDAGRSDLRDRCRARVPAGPFTVVASAWLATGRA